MLVSVSFPFDDPTVAPLVFVFELQNSSDFSKFGWYPANPVGIIITQTALCVQDFFLFVVSRTS